MSGCKGIALTTPPPPYLYWCQNKATSDSGLTQPHIKKVAEGIRPSRQSECKTIDFFLGGYCLGVEVIFWLSSVQIGYVNVKISIVRTPVVKQVDRKSVVNLILGAIILLFTRWL